MSDGFFLNRVQMSIVKIVELELNIDVRELIRAAIITASIIPESPFGDTNYKLLIITNIYKCVIPLGSAVHFSSILMS